MRILILGVSVRAMVESAVHSHYSVIALDAFGDRDLAAIAESYSLHRDFQTRYSAAELYKASRQLDYDAVAFTTDLENHPEILRRFAKNRRLIGNSPQAVARIRNWTSLFPKLKQAGFLVPETIFNDGEIDSSRRWLVKPLLSGGGHGIEFLQPDKPVDPVLFQEYIPGKPCSASFVANGSECVLVGITEQLIGVDCLRAKDFRYCGNVLPLPEALNPGVAILKPLHRLAAFITREYGLVGVNGMDFILKDDQIWLTEINPRYSASMELMERAYGLPMFRLHVNAAMDGSLPDFDLESVLSDGRFFGKAILFSDRDAKAPDTQAWASRGIRDVPASGENLRKGGPICTILASGPTYEDVLAELTAKAGALEEEIYG